MINLGVIRMFFVVSSFIHPLLGAEELDSDVPGLLVHLSREDCE